MARQTAYHDMSLAAVFKKTFGRPAYIRVHNSSGSYMMVRVTSRSSVFESGAWTKVGSNSHDDWNRAPYWGHYRYVCVTDASAETCWGLSNRSSKDDYWIKINVGKYDWDLTVQQVKDNHGKTFE